MDLAQGGPAEAAGLKVGDMITDIGGQPVAGQPLSDVRSSLKTAVVGRSLTIDFRRGDRSATTRLTPRKLIPDPDAD
jgi:C-terminal processing protease CtpA/Prc